jgi:hypothetical protein
MVMSVYWNNILLKRLKILNKKRFKYRINTDIGRFYFYFQENDEIKEGELSGRIIFFPNRDFYPK